MYQILTLNKISAKGTDLLDKTKYAFADDISSPDAILVRSASMLDMEFDGRLLSIARAGAGVNNVPVDRCTQQGIVVFNTPGANANAVKELVIAALFMASRKVAAAIDWCKTLKGEGDNVGKLVEKGKSSFAGPEIAGKTLGVIGVGAIGYKVAIAARALGMELVCYDKFITPERAATLGADAIVDSLDALYAKSDYITLHLPSLPETKGMINAESLAACKDGVRILNFARGDLVNSAALAAALASGKAAAYVTDFPTDDLIGLDGVTALPHLGASTPESEENCAVMAVNQTVDYIENGNIVNSVNFPAVSLTKSGKYRVCVTALADVSAQVKAALPDALSSAGGMKKGFYMIADTDSAVDADALKAIDGVTSVRVIG
ncbi:MAG: 3-phosphoglycerate dehydrogenase [Clostridia bacterium]|nr:3-phosphoglycerate dehydrogenase [Clostridia bacterium]